MLRVANKEGWNVALALKDPASEDLLEASLKEKLILARQSVRSKKRKTDYSSVATSSSSMAFYHTTVPQQQLPSQLSQYSPYGQMTQQFFGGQLPVQNTEKKTERLSNIICYVCEEKGHIATNCPPKKAGCGGTRGRAVCCSEGSYKRGSRLLEKNYKASGIGNSLVGERDTVISKRCKISVNGSGSKTIQFHKRGIEMARERVKQILQFGCNSLGGKVLGFGDRYGPSPSASYTEKAGVDKGGARVSKVAAESECKESRMQGYSNFNSASLGVSIMVRESLAKPKLEINCSKSGIVKELLMHAESLALNSVGPSQRSRWLDMSGQSSHVQACLNTLSKRWRRTGRMDLTENLRIKEAFRGLRLLRAQDQDAPWPWDLFPLEALKRLKDIEDRSNLLWVKIRRSKNDPFANGKFVPVERIETIQVSVKKCKNEKENSNSVSMSQEKPTKKLSRHIHYNKKHRLKKEQNSILPVEHNEPIPSDVHGHTSKSNR
ncbi:10367_t:CDS:10 [Scutellospora calospora]|uniref:10367_t:CDS:1 n=1 Tax=Scutellospora calospora TaxID=85575 RepID=A0ACA9KKL3_9GLOM|nr:10367_t:CDS:10 [Scutellospora calospora]